MALTGYPVEDLALRESFVAGSVQALQTLATRLAQDGCAELAVVVGYLDSDTQGSRDAAAVLYRGRVVARQFKHHLPNYGVFDERRYFIPGTTLTVFRLHGLEIGMVICEDIWQVGGPITALAQAGVDLVVAPNASPYERNKDDTRLALVVRRAIEVGAPLAYANLVGGQDELVFDGDSMVVGGHGELLLRAPQFTEHIVTLDLDLPGGSPRAVGRYAGLDVHRIILSNDPLPPYPAASGPSAGPATEPLSDEAEVWGALVTGLRDYARKNGFRSVVLGLSGGIDSAVCAALAVDALGADRLWNLDALVVFLGALADRCRRTRRAHRAALPGTAHRSHGRGLRAPARLFGIAQENVQARGRGVTLMALSNQYGHLVLATGNKSELAVGYSTIYGDAVGGFAPIKDYRRRRVGAGSVAQRAGRETGRDPPIPPTRSTSRLRPSFVPTSSIQTRCPIISSSTRCLTTMWKATAGSTTWWRLGSHPSWSSASCSWWTPRSTNDDSIRPERRSP